jgi:outer membrane protein TolC
MRGFLAVTIAAALAASITTQAGAQSDTTRLTLEDAIRLAQTAGPQAEMARHAFDATASRHRSLTASYLPQLSLQANIPGYFRSINPVTQPDGSTVYLPQSQSTSSVGLSLAQKVPFTGADLTFTSGLDRIYLIEDRTLFYRTTPFTVSLRQPIFQINTMRWDRAEDDLQFRIAEKEIVEAMEDVAVDVTGKFFDFHLASMDIRNAALNLANNDTLYRISKGRYNVGRIAENDLLQSELAYLRAQTELENARLSYTRAQAALRIAIGGGVPGEIAVLPPSDIPVGWIDSSIALEQARRNRSDLLDLEAQRLGAERNVAQARSDNLFNATISASLGYNQTAPELKEAYQDPLRQQQFTVRLEVPLYRWGAGSAAIDAAESEQKETEASVGKQEQDFGMELEYEVARLNLLALQVRVAAKADTIGQRRFDVAKDRYMIGKIDIPILFIAQDEKDGARRNHIQTLRDFWVSYFRLRRLTLYDFSAGRPIQLQDEPGASRE